MCLDGPEQIFLKDEENLITLFIEPRRRHGGVREKRFPSITVPYYSDSFHITCLEPERRTGDVCEKREGVLF